MTNSKYQKQKFAKKYFTIEGAESLLPKIEIILKRTIKVDKALELLSSIEIEVYDNDYNNLRMVTKMNKQFHKLSHEFYANIVELEDMGCVIKDLEIGLIDFYSTYAGEDIFLCWKIGEKKIKFWHELDCGYAGRKPILYLDKN